MNSECIDIIFGISTHTGSLEADDLAWILTKTWAIQKAMENYCINCQKKKKKKSQTGNKCWDSLWHPVQAMLQQTFNFAHVLFYCLFHRSMSVFNVLSRMEKPCQFLMEFQFHELPLLTQQTLVTRGSRPGEVNLNTSDWLPSQLPQAHFTSDLPACIHSCSSAFPLLCLLRFFFFFKYISAIR